MKFKQIRKHKIYKEWVWNDPRSSCIVFIYLMPKTALRDEFYHYKLICNEKYCREHRCNGQVCKNKLSYSSIKDNVIFDTFEECEDGVRIWFYNNKDKIYCLLWDNFNRINNVKLQY